MATSVDRWNSKPTPYIRINESDFAISMLWARLVSVCNYLIKIYITMISK